jgi:hypothetical protein
MFCNFKRPGRAQYVPQDGLPILRGCGETYNKESRRIMGLENGGSHQICKIADDYMKGSGEQVKKEGQV